MSACSGDGRDVVEVLAGRADADRVRAVLVELHPDIADRARATAAAAGLPSVEVRDRFTAAGFTELGYEAREQGSMPALGVVRYAGPPVDLVPCRPLFTFLR